MQRQGTAVTSRDVGWENGSMLGPTLTFLVIRHVLGLVGRGQSHGKAPHGRRITSTPAPYPPAILTNTAPRPRFRHQPPNREVASFSPRQVVPFTVGLA